MPSLQLMSLNSRTYNILKSSNLKAKWYTCHERTKSIVCRQWQYNIRTQNEIWWTFHFSLAFNANMVPVLTQLTVQLIIIWCHQWQSDFYTRERNSTDNLARCSGQKSHWEHDHCEKRVPRGRELSNYKHRGEAVKDW